MVNLYLTFKKENTHDNTWVFKPQVHVVTQNRQNVIKILVSVPGVHLKSSI